MKPSLRRRRKRGVFRAAFVTATLGLGALLAFAGMRVDGAARVDNAAPSDAVVVLGCAVWPGGQPSPALRARTLRGVRAWRATGSRFLLVTGGVGRNPPDEAVIMQRLALAEGVPPEAIIIDTTSRTTEASAQTVGDLARREHWKRVTLVSDPWHLLRARHMFADRGIADVRQSPAFDSPDWTEPGVRFRYTLRECVAFSIYELKRALDRC